MHPNDKKQLTEEELLAQADALLAEIASANTNFAARTDALVKDLDHGIDEAEVELAKTEKELGEIERKTIEQLDETVLTLLAENEQEEV